MSVNVSNIETQKNYPSAVSSDSEIYYPVENKRIFSESLDLELVDTGDTLRFFDSQTQKFLMTVEEMTERLTELEKQNGGN